uniref:Uncharacterized protein n=1 Tax=Rhizophora mucronata TaxID=61149 RepID=A0A2P2QK38_RHIMU
MKAGVQLLSAFCIVLFCLLVVL